MLSEPPLPESESAMRPLLRPGRAALAVAVLAIAGACQGGTPVTPGTFGPPVGGNTSGTLSGVVTEHDGQGPVTSATVLFAGHATTTDSAGQFTLNGVPTSGTGVVTVNAAGHLFRGVAVTLGTSRNDLSFDIVRNAPPFSLEFYRAFVRNNFESAVMRPTARWTRPPNFYLKTTVEAGDDIVPDAVIAEIRRVIDGSVFELSGGMFRMGTFETGTVAREPADGWVTITFHASLGSVFGQSTVGGNSGTIDIRYGMVSSDFTNPYGCLTPEVAVLDHEITHTMGFWHTREVFVDSFSGQGCPGTGRPAHVLYHASLLYSRPVGNTDPDIDPVDSAQRQALGVAPRPVVQCRFPQFHGGR
jgi:hypothetical protein